MDCNRALPEPDVRRAGPRVPAGLFAALVVAVLALLGIGARYSAHGDLNLIHSVLTSFFSINLLVCYREVCLFLRRDNVEGRADYWRQRQHQIGQAPASQFLAS